MNSDSKKAEYPKVYRSQKRNAKLEIPSMRSNLTKMLEEWKSAKYINKRYEIDTADTETSFGYKIFKKTPLHISKSNASLVPHNGKN